MHYYLARVNNIIGKLEGETNAEKWAAGRANTYLN